MNSRKLSLVYRGEVVEKTQKLKSAAIGKIENVNSN